MNQTCSVMIQVASRLWVFSSSINISIRVTQALNLETLHHVCLHPPLKCQYFPGSYISLYPIPYPDT